MKQAAAALEFERAAELRDRLQALEHRSLGVSVPNSAPGLVAQPQNTVGGDRRTSATGSRRTSKAQARNRAARWQR
jgi:hypothetical protein